MATDESLSTLMAELDITNEENEELVFDEEIDVNGNRFELCLVGRFLTEKNLNVRIMKSKLADIWRPAMGVSIKTLTPGLYLFQFYHKDDMQWMMNNGPWSFDNATLVTSKIPAGEDPTKVQLNEIEFWIQIYGLPSGFMTEAVGKQLGNFFGTFVSYDPSNSASIWREYMRLKIKVDVRMPLKRKKKICKRDRTECIVNCKYEKLGDFCFICGLLSHTERFCRKRLEGGSEMEVKGWGTWLRAPPRRGAAQGRSKWLRDDKADDWGGNHGKDKFQDFQNLNSSQSEGSQRQRREVVEDSAYIVEYTRKGDNIGSGMEGNVSSKLNIFKQNIGPVTGELDGLMVEDRKRQRVGLNDNMDVDNKYKTTNSDSGLSVTDCTESSGPVLAELAKQASQPK